MCHLRSLLRFDLGGNSTIHIVLISHYLLTHAFVPGTQRLKFAEELAHAVFLFSTLSHLTVQFLSQPHRHLSVLILLTKLGSERRYLILMSGTHLFRHTFHL